jgi:hypothetical protein
MSVTRDKSVEEGVVEWVKSVAEYTKPYTIHWCDGTETEARRLEWTAPGSVDGLALSASSVGVPVLDGVGPGLAATRGSTSDRASNAPAFPVWDAAGRMTQTCACDVDAKHRRRMGHGEVADPFGGGRSSVRDGMLGRHGAHEGTPFRVREADEDAVVAGMRTRRPPEFRHEFSISESRRLVERATVPLMTPAPSARHGSGARS